MCFCHLSHSNKFQRYRSCSCSSLLRLKVQVYYFLESAISLQHRGKQGCQGWQQFSLEGRLREFVGVIGSTVQPWPHCMVTFQKTATDSAFGAVYWDLPKILENVPATHSLHVMLFVAAGKFVCVRCEYDKNQKSKHCYCER